MLYQSVTGRRLQLSVQPGDTIEIVKQQLIDGQALPEGSVSLFFEGMRFFSELNRRSVLLPIWII